MAARSFVHGRPILNDALSPLLRPVLKHLPGVQGDPALTAFERFAHTSGPTSFVQLGSHDGITNDPLHPFVVSRPDWSGVVVEPVPEHFDALRTTYACLGERVRFERAVVSDQEGRVPFYRLPDVHGLPPALRQVGSLSRAHVQGYATALADPADVIEEAVASTTLPALLGRQQITRLDLLHMDIEGAEPLVLSQIDFDAPSAPHALLFEHTHLSSADFRSWMTRLRNHGYVLAHGRQDTWAQRSPVPEPS